MSTDQTAEAQGKQRLPRSLAQLLAGEGCWERFLILSQADPAEVTALELALHARTCTLCSDYIDQQLDPEIARMQERVDALKGKLPNQRRRRHRASRRAA